ncbi:hypothetical protein MTsPCn5_25200 [Croceitalea sp. MTPC5]|uniref:hypothetical protein n=1 Tax=Croceitalea sp. MTPC5 TaxID=3056565 RepID=UPI002B3F282C|nr:hypothetical protein MTsPCn5_25200 [Croceitalea sp. MTPC5]
MKKVVLALAILVGFTSLAQRGVQKGPKERLAKDLTVEQLATLQTKKMALALDLTEEQMQQVMEFNKTNAEFRKTRMEEREAKRESGDFKRPTAEERFALENAKLDRQLAQQGKLKQILNDEQYQLWKKMSLRRYAHGKKRMQKEVSRR